MNKPCPKCGGSAIKQHDCGYSSFNPVWIECASCKFAVPGNLDNWNGRVSLYLSKKVPARSKRQLSDAIARLYDEEQLWKILFDLEATKYA